MAKEAVVVEAVEAVEAEAIEAKALEAKEIEAKAAAAEAAEKEAMDKEVRGAKAPLHHMRPRRQGRKGGSDATWPLVSFSLCFPFAWRAYANERTAQPRSTTTA
jgi:hypothetical protein